MAPTNMLVASLNRSTTPMTPALGPRITGSAHLLSTQQPLVQGHTPITKRSLAITAVFLNCRVGVGFDDDFYVLGIRFFVALLR